MNNPEGYTIRWRRGEAVAYVLAGKQLDSRAITGVLTTVEVPPHGWIDLDHAPIGGWLRAMTEGERAGDGSLAVFRY